jgi:MoxR-like ATPase
MSDWSTRPFSQPTPGSEEQPGPGGYTATAQAPAAPSADAGRASRAGWFANNFSALQHNVESFIRGKSSVVRMALVCMMAEGHLLIDDIPGVGKTSLAKSIANSFEGSFARIQFTPDLLPSDVTGTQVWNANTREFEFRPGPIFANLVVGDEINRASPKTQSALLEVMEERQVTVDGTPYLTPRPFLVIATQNPVEFDGTYNLPEAQIDRFMMRLSIGYPDHEYEVEVIRNRSAGRSADDVRPVMDVKTAETMVAITHEIYVAAALHSYIVSICAATRKLPELRLGVSPRGSLALVTGSQAFAASSGREFVTADDIKIVAPYVLGHRMLLTSEAELAGATAQSLLQQITSAVPLPEDRG